MTHLKTRLVCISFATITIMCRWVSLDNPLPTGWTPDTPVRYTARVLEPLYHKGSNNIITRGLWMIRLPDSAEITLGTRYSMIGRVETRVLLGKVTHITMEDPTIVVLPDGVGEGPTLLEKAKLSLSRLRVMLISFLEKSLPTPHSGLLAGIILGSQVELPHDFYDALRATGTMHIVAASGYNVQVVAQSVIGAAALVIGRRVGLLIAMGTILIYVVLSGGSAAVVRAGIMGAVTLAAQYWGKQATTRRVFWGTVWFMLAIKPLYLVDVGFQLSVAATAGLLYIQPLLDRRLRAFVCRDSCLVIKKFLASYLTPTLAATLSTLPIIAWYFGNISLISPVSNVLILPIIPLTMFLGVVLLITYPLPLMHELVAWLTYVPLWWIVEVIRWLG